MIRCPQCGSADCLYGGGFHERIVYLCETCNETFTIKTDELPEDSDDEA